MIDDMAEVEEPAGSQLHLEKSLAVPNERVFAAFVDPEQLRRWWGPIGFTVRELQFDAVEGTEYRIAIQPPEGDAFHISGIFRAVEPPHRLSFTFNYEEPDPDDQETLVRLTFEPTEGGTRVILDQGPFNTATRVDLHRDGWTETFERFERSFATP
jgi:uncharacterized protein YndB with AHSA1/START domain